MSSAYNVAGLAYLEEPGKQVTKPINWIQSMHVYATLAARAGVSAAGRAVGLQPGCLAVLSRAQQASVSVHVVSVNYSTELVQAALQGPRLTVTARSRALSPLPTPLPLVAALLYQWCNARQLGCTYAQVQCVPS